MIYRNKNQIIFSTKFFLITSFVLSNSRKMLQNLYCRLLKTWEYVSLIVPRNDRLDNEVNEVNSRLIKMCQQQNIKIINCTDQIDPSKHLNESLFHINRYRAIKFVKNFKTFLCNLDWRDAVGISEGLDHYEGKIPDLSENGDEVSILFP